MEGIEKIQAPPAAGEKQGTSAPKASSASAKVRLWVVLGTAALAEVLLHRDLLGFFNYARLSEVHSYVLLIPVVVVYLLFLRARELPAERSPGRLSALTCMGLAIAALVFSHQWRSSDTGDQFTFLGLAVCLFCWAAVFFYFGKAWFYAAIFPLAFLLFVVPLPSAVVDTLENWSKIASAEVADWMFAITGTPNLRNGQIFQLPGMTIEVAKECSGIRSSLVLVITSILAANLFLRTNARRFWLVASVIPLGLLRNGFRILVVSLLCVHIGPYMIDSPIHRRGGPIFFALSLIPLFTLLWLLHRSEIKRDGALPPPMARR